jgi:hypothetical protein
MFAHIRKHQQWLFVFIIAAVIVSFVIFFTPTVGTGGGGGTSQGGNVVGTIDGQNVTQEEYQDAYGEVSLQVYLQMGRWPEQLGNQFGFDPQQQARSRLVMLRKLDAMGMQVGDEAVAKWKVNFFSDPETEAFRRELYDTVLENIKARGMTEEDLNRYAANQIGIGQLTSLVSLSGELIPPREIERVYRDRNLSATTMAILFSRTNHIAAAQDLTGLETYFTNNMAVYRVQEKRKIRYVKFAATNYLAEAETQLNQSTNLQAMVDAIYLEKGTNSFTENGVTLTEEKAKEQIRSEELNKKGLDVAVDRTKQFMQGFAKFGDLSSGALEQLATEMEIESKISSEFSRNQLPPGLGVPFTFTQQAYQLTEEEPIGSPLETTDAIFVLALEEIIPDHPPTLDEVRVRVTGDFRREKQLEAAREEAKQVRENLKTAMDGGQTFTKACEELGQTIVEIPPFSLTTRSLEDLKDRRITVSWLQNLAFAMNPENISDVSETSDGAGVLYLKSFVEADTETMTTEMADFSKELSQTRQNETVSAWMQEQREAIAGFGTENINN